MTVRINVNSVNKHYLHEKKKNSKQLFWDKTMYHNSSSSKNGKHECNKIAITGKMEKNGKI